MYTGVVQNIACQADRFLYDGKKQKIFMTSFLASKQPSTVKNGSQCPYLLSYHASWNAHLMNNLKL
jgi:hypothetical protein